MLAVIWAVVPPLVGLVMVGVVVANPLESVLEL